MVIILFTKTSHFTSDKPHYENVPFEIPDGWCWTTVEEVCSKFSTGPFGSMVHKTDYVANDGVPMVNPANIVNSNVSNKYLVLVSVDKAKDLRKYRLEEGDVVIARRGDLSKCAVINKKQQGFLCGTGSFSLHLIYILPEYFQLVYLSPYVQSILNTECVGATMNNLNQGVLGAVLFPLPPLNEQYKILLELEKHFSFIDLLESKSSNLYETIKQAKSKILDLAIHGKLVPQNPMDEPARELLKRINPKAEITSDNGHYQKLPEGWAVCCLENVAKVLDNLRKPINSNERNSRIANKHESELFPYYGATGQVGFIDDYLVDGKFLLLGEDGAPFLDKYAIKSYPIKGKCWVNNHAHILKPLCDFDYLMYYLNHVDYKDYVNGSTRLKLTQSDMRSIKILLPPLTEQKRISVKIKYLFCLLDTIACHL